MLTLFRKEILSFLNSLIGYIVMSVFLLINGLFLWVFPMESNILDSGFANLDGLFLIAPFVFLFLIPAITMKFFAEEKRSGTIELLYTKPITDFGIILGKYFAGLVLVIISILPTLVYYISVYRLGLPPGNLDSGGIWGSFIGLLFLAASFVAIGVFASSLTSNQVISFIISVIICGFFYLGFEFIYSLDLFGKIDLFIRNLGISAHYSSMSRGVIDTRDMIYFLSLVAVFILFTHYSLERRKH